MPAENAPSSATEPVKGYVDEEGVTHEIYALQPQTTDEAPVCFIHNRVMRKRLRKDGGYWFDHRWQEEGVWQQCSGRPKGNRSEELPEDEPEISQE